MGLSKGLSEFLRANNLSPDDSQEDRGAAIHLAIVKGLSGHAEELLGLYPKECVGAVDRTGKKRGRMPLHNAAQLGMRSVLLQLLDLGADIDARTRGGWTALMLAVESGRSEVVSLLLDRGADLEAHTNVDIKTTDRKQLTALHVAAELKSPNVILQLLHRGAKYDFATIDGDTALHFAVRERCLPAAALLLLHGASSHAKNKARISPRNLITKFQRGERHKFQHMLSCHTTDTKQQFLTCVDDNLVDPDLPNAVHRAVEGKMIGAIIYLLHMNPRLVIVKNKAGWQPLHTAAKLGYTEVARILLKHGAEVNCLTKRNWTPVMLAVNYNQIEVLRVLLEYHPNTLMKSTDDWDAVALGQRHGDAILDLLPTFRHIHKDLVPSGKNDMLRVPIRPKLSREPSPARSETSDLEGELFSLSDATKAFESRPFPTNSEAIEKLFQDLEHTWYEKIQWNPNDDIRNGPEWSGPVKIAILDTGIDLEHDDFQRPPKRRSRVGQLTASHLVEKPQKERIRACRNFIGSPGDEEDVQDTVGHGTHIAGLILSIAPRAELYIAKTSSGEGLANARNGDSGRRQAKRKGQQPVQEALRWAIDQGVDIINLSLGFPEEGSYDLTRALEDANHKGIIVFAAAANHGNREDISWPARDPELAICVTSGDDYNNRSKFAPSGNKNLPVFMTHGESLCSQWPTNLGGGFRTMSGTSVSTPIAVGMAAMILSFLNTTNYWSAGQKREWLDRSAERRLRSTRGMGRLLGHICRDRDGLKVLSPKLMWRKNTNANPFQALSTISQAFRVTG